MITCAEQLISEYIDGDLSPAVARELEDHFRRCANCLVARSCRSTAR
jgi:anti-sigma factor RsiW